MEKRVACRLERGQQIRQKCIKVSCKSVENGCSKRRTRLLDFSQRKLSKISTGTNLSRIMKV